MNHAPYEEWLFEDVRDLSAEQAVDLNAHLQACAGCRALSQALGSVERSLRAEPMLEPGAGFALRFQSRLEDQRRRLHRRQTLLTLGLGMGGLVALVCVGLAFAWPYFGAMDATLWAGLYQLFGLAVIFQEIGRFFSTLFQASFDVLPVVLWIFVVGVLCQLSVLWVVSYRLLTNPRRLTR